MMVINFLKPFFSLPDSVACANVSGQLKTTGENQEWNAGL